MEDLEDRVQALEAAATFLLAQLSERELQLGLDETIPALQLEHGPRRWHQHLERLLRDALHVHRPPRSPRAAFD